MAGGAGRHRESLVGGFFVAQNFSTSDSQLSIDLAWQRHLLDDTGAFGMGRMAVFPAVGRHSPQESAASHCPAGNAIRAARPCAISPGEEPTCVTILKQEDFKMNKLLSTVAAFLSIVAIVLASGGQTYSRVDAGGPTLRMLMAGNGN